MARAVWYASQASVTSASATRSRSSRVARARSRAARARDSASSRWALSQSGQAHRDGHRAAGEPVGVEAISERGRVGAQHRLGEVPAARRPDAGFGGALVGPRDPVFGALLQGQAHRFRKGEGKIAGARGIERHGIDAARGADPPSQQQPGHPEPGLVLEQGDSGAIELQHQLQRIGLDRGAAHDPGARDDAAAPPRAAPGPG